MYIDFSDNIAHEVLLTANNCMFIPPLTPQLQKKAPIDKNKISEEAFSV